MDTHKKRLHREAIDKLAAYFDSPEQFDKEVSEILYEARRKLVKNTERKKREATKEWLNEYWASLPWNKDNTLLEEEEWFVGWLGELNRFGHQMFLHRCRNCNGTQEISSSGLTMRCTSCRGSREEEEFVGPRYCHRCNALFGTCGARCPGRAHY